MCFLHAVGQEEELLSLTKHGVCLEPQNVTLCRIRQRDTKYPSVFWKLQIKSWGWNVGREEVGEGRPEGHKSQVT